MLKDLQRQAELVRKEQEERAREREKQEELRKTEVHNLQMTQTQD